MPQQLPGLSFFFPAFDEEETGAADGRGRSTGDAWKGRRFLAYPYESFDRSRSTRSTGGSARPVIDAGVRAAFTSVAGSVSSRTDAYFIPRCRVLRTADVAAVAPLLRGDDWYVFVQRIQAMVGIRVRQA